MRNPQFQSSVLMKFDEYCRMCWKVNFCQIMSVPSHIHENVKTGRQKAEAPRLEAKIETIVGVCSSNSLATR